MPVAKARGDEVFAGTVNGSGVLHLVVTRDPSQTVVARIVELVADASATKAKPNCSLRKSSNATPWAWSRPPLPSSLFR